MVVKNRWYIVLSSIVMFILLVSSILFFNYESYLLLSFSIIAITMLLFFIRFEVKKISSREIVILAILAAIAAVSRVPFAPLPRVQPTSFVIMIAGLVFVILGTMVHVIGLGQSSGKQKISTIYRFWKINVWTVIFIPLALIYNVIMEGIPAPYPMININTIYAFAVFWLVYFLIGGEVMSICRKREKEQRHED